MATYSTPDGATIRSYSRLQGEAFGITNTALETALAAIVAQGEDVVFLRVGESYETESLATARLARALQAAVSYRTSAFYVRELWVDRTGGTHEPLLVEESERIAALAAEFEAKAEEYEDLLKGRGETSGKRPKNRPSFAAIGVTVSSSDRTPSERLQLMDESDDISSEDTDAG